MTDGRLERAEQRARIRGNEHMLARYDFEQVRVDQRAHLNVQVQLFGYLAYEAFGGGLAEFDSAAGQFPLFPFIEQQDDLARGRAQDAFDGDGVGGHSAHRCRI